MSITTRYVLLSVTSANLSTSSRCLTSELLLEVWCCLESYVYPKWISSRMYFSLMFSGVATFDVERVDAGGVLKWRVRRRDERNGVDLSIVCCCCCFPGD